MQTKNTKSIQISLLLVATLGVMSGVTVVSSLPLMSKAFSTIPHIEFLSKLMLTIPSIVIALSAPFSGHIVDRLGRLKPLYIGIILFILGGSSGFYLHNFYAILAGRGVLGLAVALIMTSSTALIGDYFREEERHRFMSRQGLAVAMGGILFISQAESTWQLFFATTPIGMAFGLLFVNTNAWFLSKVPPAKRGKASGILTSSFFLGQFSSPLLFEPIVSAYGIQGLFLIISVLSIVVSAVLFVRSGNSISS